MMSCQGSSLALPYRTRYGSAYATRTPQMKHHVLGWISSPLEDHLSVHPITLMWLCWQTWASSEPVTSPVTPPALVPLRTHQPLKHCYHSFTLTPRFQNLVLRSNLGITNTVLNITISILVPVPVPVLILVPFCPMFWHRIPVFPSVHTAFLCSDLYFNMFLFLMVCPLTRILDPHLVLYSICSNIDFDYCSQCLLNLWSLPTSISIIRFPTLGILWFPISIHWKYPTPYSES